MRATRRTAFGGSCGNSSFVNHARELKPLMTRATARDGPVANEKGHLMKKAIVLFLASIGVLFLVITGAYWWSNTPPGRPSDVSANGVFLWAGHLGLPAPRHGTWIECWTDSKAGVNKCRLTEMDGTRSFEGAFLADTSRAAVPQSELEILSEQTSQSVDLWVRVNGEPAPLVFLRNGKVLIPSDAYEEGMAKLQHLCQIQGK